jgi:hypothetical protein
VNERKEMSLRRRDLLRAVTAGVVAAVSSLDEVEAASGSLDDKRKARYQPNSAEVQDFYRVNRYPAR